MRYSEETVPTFNFDEKYVLITGAGSGIGRAIAESFLSAGAYVGVHYSSNEKGARELVKTAKSGRCHLIQSDFGKPGAAIGAWQEFVKFSKGRIDVLVNNAATTGTSPSLFDVTETEWDELFNINLKVPMLLGRAALAVMNQQRDGSIVNISSIGVKFGGGLRTKPYSISKAALEALTKSLASLAAPNNVRVNALRVGVTKTSLHQKIGVTNLDERIARIPMKRAAEPEEIAKTVLFLASKGSSFINGAIVPVSGGE
jgi:NAD(P)-dependent dehydrogenase (short-subunit alcohol dehydrogenase family)